MGGYQKERATDRIRRERRTGQRSTGGSAAASARHARATGASLITQKQIEDQSYPRYDTKGYYAKKKAVRRERGFPAR